MPIDPNPKPIELDPDRDWRMRTKGHKKHIATDTRIPTAVPAPDKLHHTALSTKLEAKITDDMMAVARKLKDPKAFIERFFWIVDRSKQTVPFIFNEPQRLYYSARSTHDLILKARKEGFSSLIEAINLHACLMFQNEHAVTMSHNFDETKVHLDRVNFFLEHLGNSIFKWEVTLDEKNQKEISFPLTNSKFWIGTAGAKAFGRGRDITRLHCTEVAHYEDQSVLTAALGACVDEAWRVLETTANGVGEKFHELWEQGKDKAQGSTWKPHFFSWFQDPANQRPVEAAFKLKAEEQKIKSKFNLTDNQMTWYRWKRGEEPDKTKFPQEYPCDDQEAFISSGRHIFNISNLKIMDDRIVTRWPDGASWVGELDDDGSTVQFLDNPEGNFHMWINRRDEHRYLISGDVAKGIPDGAFSVATVWDRSSWEVCAEWRGRIDPGKFGEIMCVMGYFFNDALLVPENNNHGAATIERMKAMNYHHILKSNDLWKDIKNADYGFPTNIRTKELLISALRNSIDDQSYFENSRVAIHEMMRAVRDEKGDMVSEGAFLDTIITRGIGLYCLKFLTLDATYRESNDDAAPMKVTSLVKFPHRKPR